METFASTCSAHWRQGHEAHFKPSSPPAQAGNESFSTASLIRPSWSGGIGRGKPNPFVGGSILQPKGRSTVLNVHNCHSAGLYRKIDGNSGERILFSRFVCCKRTTLTLPSAFSSTNMGALHYLPGLLSSSRRTKRPPSNTVYNDCKTTFWAALLQPTLANIKINEVGIFSCSTEDDGLASASHSMHRGRTRCGESRGASVGIRRLGAITISLKSQKAQQR